MFEGKRITLRRLLTRKFRLQASLAIETMITTDNVLNMIPKMEGICIEFALGILNSKLISWVYVNTSMIAQRDDFRIQGERVGMRCQYPPSISNSRQSSPRQNGGAGGEDA